MKLHILFAAAIVSVSPLAGCADETEAAYGTTATKTKTYTFEERESFRTDIEREIGQLEVRLSELRAQAAVKGQELKEGAQELIDDIEAELVELRRKLAEVGTATRESWDAFRADFSAAVADLRGRIDRAFEDT